MKSPNPWFSVPVVTGFLSKAAVAFWLIGSATGHAATLQKKLVLHGESSELSSVTDGAAVKPAAGPAGVLQINGTGSLLFQKAASGNGVAFLTGGQQRNNSAYYEFTGAALAPIIGAATGEIDFTVVSRFSPAERKQLRTYQFLFDTWDDSGADLAFFYIDSSSGNDLRLVYQVGGAAGAYVPVYILPADQEQALLGKGVALNVRLVWDGSQCSLYLNGQSVKSFSYNPMSPVWGANARLTIGARNSSGGPGYFSFTDLLDEFSILSGAAPVLPVIQTFRATPSSAVQGQNIALTWTASGAASLDIDNGVGTVAGTTKTITATSSTTYTLTARNAAGAVANHVPVTVVPRPSIASFTATPAAINVGASAKLAWSATGASAFTIDNGVGAVTGSSLTVTPSKTTTYTLKAANGSLSDTASVTVTVLQKPVITSFTASPAEIKAGSSTKLAWNATGAATLTIDNGVGAVTGTSKTITPSKTTTYTLTASNNAGSTTAHITVTVDAAPVISAFTATPAQVNAGGSTKLAWSVSGAATLTIDNAVGAVTGTSKTITPAKTTTYTLTASGSGGSTTAKVTVTVVTAPVISSFTASAATVNPGEASTLSWNATGAATLTIDNGVGAVTGTSKAVTPAKTTTYILTATNSSGSSTARLTITVAVVPVISSFTASSASIAPGQSSTLSWNVTGATTLAIDNGVGTVTGTSKAVSPAKTTTYTLTASSAAGSVTARLTVTVSGVPAILSYTVSPAVITPGQSSTLYWNVAGATSVTIDNGIGAVSGTSTSVSPSQTTTYTLTAVNASGSATATVTVALGTALTGNGITISEPAGTAASNYPVQIGRPFRQGDFPEGTLPQAVIDGIAVPTQVDVKQRWSDRSLKHAVLSFLIPALAPYQRVTVMFAPVDPAQTPGNTPLTRAEMLSADYNFDAVMTLTGSTSTTHSASARTMLSNGDFTYWVSGPIATTVILADHSNTQMCNGRPASRYDFGFDADCPFRPIYEATFWPATKQVRVRFIGEIAESEHLKTFSAKNLVLAVGETAPSVVYTLPGPKRPLTMAAETRWTKVYWLHGTPGPLSIDHNLAYLVQTRFFPNYDLTKPVTEAFIASQYSRWLASDHDLNGIGSLWTVDWGQPGASAWIGPNPTWTTVWLYSGDYRLAEMAFGHADLAAGYPYHIREGRHGKDITRSMANGCSYQCSADGMGKVLSISSRPTYLSSNLNYSYTTPSDAVKYMGKYGGATAENGLKLSASHFPDTWMPQYVLTGEHWYLEEAQFGASYVVSWTNGAAPNSYTGRGPSGSEGGFFAAENRQLAWTLRAAASAAFASPDNTPEKSYFETLIDDFVAIEEGARGISSPFAQAGNPQYRNWMWGKSVRSQVNGNLPYPVLHQWFRGLPIYLQPGYGIAEDKGAGTVSVASAGSTTTLTFSNINACRELSVNQTVLVPVDGPSLIIKSLACPVAIASGGIPAAKNSSWGSVPLAMEGESLFGADYLMYALGRSTEMGYSTGNLTSWLGQLYTGMLTDIQYNPRLAFNGRIPTTRLNGSYIDNFAELKTGFDPSWQNFTAGYSPLGPGVNGPPSGYAAYVLAAVSFLRNEPNGAAAWSWLERYVLPDPGFNNNPQWAIVPR